MREKGRQTGNRFSCDARRKGRRRKGRIFACEGAKKEKRKKFSQDASIIFYYKKKGGKMEIPTS